MTGPFTEKFDNFTCEGDTITTEVDGFTLTAVIRHDPDAGPDSLDCYSEEAIEAWEKDEWHFSGLVVSVSRNGVTLDEHAAALWGVERNFPGTDNSYLSEVANELADEALDAGKAVLKTLLNLA